MLDSMETNAQAQNQSSVTSENLKADYISVVAHELKTPLTALRGYLSVFIDENSKNFTQEQNMFLNRMNIASQQLGSLIDNLLNASRIDRGVLAIDPQPSEWFPIAKLAVEEFENRAKEKQIQLELIEPKEVLPVVLVDKLRITEVLLNLISNAIAYNTPTGKVTVWTEIMQDCVVTHVQDTGPGIPKESLPNLFTKFFRAENVKRSTGTGLGLYISKTIVDMHKGRIWAESEVGKGSIFSFSVPVAQSL